MDDVVVAFSVDNKYAIYLQVAIRSLVDHIANKRLYKIIILYSDLSDVNRTMLNNTVRGKKNVQLIFTDVTRFFENYHLNTANEKGEQYLSVVTYYRLILHELDDNLDKVLYLDCDVIIEEDVAKLFDIDLKKNLMAAVPDVCDNWKCNIKKSKLKTYRENILKIYETNTYFNAGVIVINLSEIRKNYKKRELLDIANQYKWLKHDQDVLNKIGYQKTLLLPISWNFIENVDQKNWKYWNREDKKQYENAQKKPYIIHFAAQKPWEKKGVYGERIFWMYFFNNMQVQKIVNDWFESCVNNRDYGLEIYDKLLRERKVPILFELNSIWKFLWYRLHNAEVKKGWEHPNE